MIARRIIDCLRLLLAVVAAAGILLTAVDRPASAQMPVAAPGGNTERISDGVVRIGLLLDMSGPYADQTGIGSLTAARMAVEDFGGKVLGVPIEVVAADHHDNADQAAAIAREWFGPGQVDAIMDVAGSSEALIVQAIGATYNKIVSLSAPGAARLTNEACSPTAVHYVFNTYATALTLGQELVRRGGDTWFFITVDYSFGYDLENDTAAVVTANRGRILGHARHPLNAAGTTSSYLQQARQSQAKVIGLANAGEDAIGTIHEARELGMIPGPQIFAALGLRFTNVAALGLETAQGLMVAEPFYWDLDDATRAWSRRFLARVNKMPNSLQAGVYSSTMHYLRAVAAAETDATVPVMRAMRTTPVDDFFAHNGIIRADGVMIHDMRVFQVKSPAESKYPWDYYRLVATIPGDQAFLPLAQSRCPLARE
jgi:branched-chain amino acid transport system substrate-binding protein